MPTKGKTIKRMLPVDRPWEKPPILTNAEDVEAEERSGRWGKIEGLRRTKND
jgi:hypothetical protein